MQPYKFILIDDVASNNLITKMNIRNVYPGSSVVAFTDARAGYDYIVEQYSKPGDHVPAILLLDIYTPIMDAWQFLGKFDLLNESVKSKVSVYLLSSSINDDDGERAKADKNVSGYILKPITEEVLKALTL